MKNTNAGQIDWRTWRSNLALLSIWGVVSFLLSGGHFLIAIFAVCLIAPLYEWKRIEAPVEDNARKPLSQKGKEAMRDHLVEIGQISDKS